MNYSARRNSGLLLLAFVAALVLLFGGIVADAVAGAVEDVEFSPTSTEVES
jgi:hypothetical protein